MEQSDVKVVSWLEKLLKPVYEMKFGMGGKVALRPGVLSSAPNNLLALSENALGDQICLMLPYADIYLTCTLSFVWIDPTIPPEVVAAQLRNDRGDTIEQEGYLDYFMSTYKADFGWNPYKDCNAMVNLVQLLLDSFCKYQHDRCIVNSKFVESEINALSSAEIKFHMYEVEHRNSPSSMVLVSFLSASDLDRFSLASEHDKCFAVIATIGRGRGKWALHLELGPFLKRLCQGHIKDFPWATANGGIVSCVTLAQCLVTAAVQHAMNAIKINRALVSLLKDSNHCTMIDYSPFTWENASFLYNDNEFTCVLKVSFPLVYPGNMIQVEATSIQGERSTRPREPIKRMAACDTHHKNPKEIYSDLWKIIEDAVTSLEMSRLKINNRK